MSPKTIRHAEAEKRITFAEGSFHASIKLRNARTHRIVSPKPTKNGNKLSHQYRGTCFSLFSSHGDTALITAQGISRTTIETIGRKHLSKARSPGVRLSIEGRGVIWHRCFSSDTNTSTPRQTPRALVLPEPRHPLRRAAQRNTSSPSRTSAPRPLPVAVIASV